MKKHRKLVALLVALTFLFSVVAPAMAATPSEAEKAADKLNVLGIIEGYPDGSFGLDQNITRAEFAKIAVAAAGLTEAAEQLVNFPSQFSDVKVGEWYTGWINMAASQGFVKGDPDGRFRPNDNITYAEVVTVLVRLLGYDDNLTGPWPTNYLAKAVELDITEGVAINASAPAVRGDVFIMANNTLDCYTVYWNADNLDWTVKDDKLIVKSFKGVMDKGIVTDISWDSKGDVFVDLVSNDGDRNTNVKLIDNVIVTGADDVYGLLGKQVEYIQNDKDKGADRNAIVYLGLKETDSISDDKAELVGDRYIEIDGKRYDVADRNFGVTEFPAGDTGIAGRDEVFEGDKVEVVLNEDGDAQWVFVYDFENPDVIEEIDGDRAFGFIHARIDYDEDDVQVFIKDGVLASFEDLAEGDLVYVYDNDERNTDLLVFAVSEASEGELERANNEYSKLWIAGEGIDADDTDYILSEDGGESFDRFSEELINGMFGEDVSYMLSPAGKIAVVIAGDVAESTIGVVEAFLETARGWETRILTPSGDKVVYYVDTDYTEEFGKAVSESGSGKSVLVEYSLDKNGRIDDVRVASPAKFIDDESNRARLAVDDEDARWYRFGSKPAFFGRDSAHKMIASGWDTFRDIADKDTDVSVLFNKSNAIIAMLTEEVITSDGNFGVIAGRGYNKDGMYYDVFFDGEKTRYNVTSTIEKNKDLGALKNGTVIKFTLASDKINNIYLDIADPEDYGYISGEVTRTGSDYIEVDGDDYYYTDEDTMIVDITADKAGDWKTARRVGQGDLVRIVFDREDNLAKLVVIVPEDRDEDDGEDEEITGGVVTYINTSGTGADYAGTLIVDSKTTYFVDSKTVVTDKDDIVLFIGATDVTPAGYEGDNSALAQDDIIEVTAKDGVATTIKRLSTKAERDAIEALKDAKADAAELVEANYTSATWADLEDALAMDEDTHVEVLAKTSAINTAISNLAPSEAYLEAIATEIVEDLEAAVADIETAYAGDLTTATGRGVLQDAIDEANNIISGLSTEITDVVDATKEAALQARWDEAVEAVEVAEDVLDIYATGVGPLTVAWNTDEATTIGDVETAVADALAVTNSSGVATWVNPPTITSAGLAAADYQFEIELTNGSVVETITLTVNVTVTAAP